jgi:hypothetical protein
MQEFGLTEVYLNLDQSVGRALLALPFYENNCYQSLHLTPPKIL